MFPIRFSSLKVFVNSEIPSGTNILLVGPPGVGKTAFCETLLCECLRNRDEALYITLDHDPKDIRVRISKRGTDLVGEKKKLVFVDGYSWLVGESNERFNVRNLSNLSDLSVKIFGASSELGEGFSFVFDSISTLLVYNSENEVERFLESNMARMKHVNSVGFWIVEQGIHSERFYSTLRHRADGILEMRFEENEELKRFIRMHTFKGISHSTSWKPFVVSEEGIVTIGEEKHL